MSKLILFLIVCLLCITCCCAEDLPRIVKVSKDGQRLLAEKSDSIPIDCLAEIRDSKLLVIGKARLIRKGEELSLWKIVEANIAPRSFQNQKLTPIINDQQKLQSDRFEKDWTRDTPRRNYNRFEHSW